MPDQQPPRLHADESETLRALLQFQRESFIRKVEGSDDTTARQSPVASGTSLLWLTRHLAFAERIWVIHRFAGQEAVPTDGTSDTDTIAAAIAAYRSTWLEVDAIVDGAESLDQMCATTDGQSPVNLRWVLAHLLEEIARHAGHADIIREAVDGATAFPLMAAAEGWPATPWMQPWQPA